MQQIVLGSLAGLLVVVSPALANAETVNPDVPVNTSDVVNTAATTRTAPPRFQPNPAQLIDLGYRGKLKTAGVPGFNRFIDARLRAEELVEAAISIGVLTPETLENESYVNGVRAQLHGFRPHTFRGD